MFGKVRETHKMNKLLFIKIFLWNIKGCWFELTRNYREAYGIHAQLEYYLIMNLKRRGYEFVTRKISQGVANIKLKKQKTLELGILMRKEIGVTLRSTVKLCG